MRGLVPNRADSDGRPSLIHVIENPVLTDAEFPDRLDMLPRRGQAHDCGSSGYVLQVLTDTLRVKNPVHATNSTPAAHFHPPVWFAIPFQAFPAVIRTVR